MGLFLLHVAYLSMSEKFNYGYNMAVCVIAGVLIIMCKSSCHT